MSRVSVFIVGYLLCCLASFSFGNDIILNGVITAADGKPVENCVIRLKNRAPIKAVSLSDGTFRLVGTGMIKKTTGDHMNGFTVRFRRNALLIHIPRYVSRLRVTGYNLQGRLLYASVNRDVGAGQHSLQLDQLHSGCAIAVIRIDADGRSVASKFFNGSLGRGVSSSVVSACEERQLRQSAIALYQDSTISDSLICVKPGLGLGFYALTTYKKDDIKITLKPVASTDGMKLIHARDSSFSMGSENGRNDEKPVHSVRFSTDFLMDSIEVTQSRFASIMTAVYEDYVPVIWLTACSDTVSASRINWFGAMLYCNAVSKICGLDTVYRYTDLQGSPGGGCWVEGAMIADHLKNGFRLPTEAQWEYACRGGTATDYYWGNQSSDASPFVWYCENTQKGAFKNQSNGLKKPNGWGLYDMSGKLREWCNDWYDSTYYSRSAPVDPPGADTSFNRVVRGGSWGSELSDCRSANRGYRVEPIAYSRYIGFRSVLPAR
ncbi:MAG: SUMF1/EgtB/PvdO family nonheme iron enzyme [Chitinivibrionales bacterium]|nr:SUMF1/EgtB/PvdO family nonheme iron enzyme [Chitinivibrionales bacterium]